MRRLALASLLSLVGVGVGCGLISSDVAEIKFNLPPRMYSFDSSTFNVPAGITGEVPCGAGQIVTDCCNPPAPLPAPDCSANPITCEPEILGGMDSALGSVISSTRRRCRRG